ncbi:hypothetical protein H8958_001284 [Nasalis larvatus]
MGAAVAVTPVPGSVDWKSQWAASTPLGAVCVPGVYLQPTLAVFAVLCPGEMCCRQQGATQTTPTLLGLGKPKAMHRPLQTPLTWSWQGSQWVGGMLRPVSTPAWLLLCAFKAGFCAGPSAFWPVTCLGDLPLASGAFQLASDNGALQALSHCWPDQRQGYHTGKRRHIRLHEPQSRVFIDIYLSEGRKQAQGWGRFDNMVSRIYANCKSVAEEDNATEKQPKASSGVPRAGVASVHETGASVPIRAARKNLDFVSLKEEHDYKIHTAFHGYLTSKNTTIKSPVTCRYTSRGPEETEDSQKK